MQRLLSTLRVVHQQVSHSGTGTGCSALCRTLVRPPMTTSSVASALSCSPSFPTSLQQHHLCTTSTTDDNNNNRNNNTTTTPQASSKAYSSTSTSSPSFDKTHPSPSSSAATSSSTFGSVGAHGSSDGSGMQPKEPSGESIRPPPPTDDELDGGRTLARLAKLAALLKHTLEHEEIGQIQMPSMAVEMEQEAEEAYRIIQGALDKVGNPCSVEQLGDRARGVDVIPIPTSALNYKDYLRATDLRDRFERSLYMMDIFPPKESNLDGQGRPNCRLERKRRRERELAGLPPIEDEYDDDMLSEDDKEMKKLTIHRHEGYEEFSPGIQLTEGLDMSSSSTATGAAGLLQKQHAFELPELRPITKFELARRKKHLEESATISNILKGFDTALLQVGRVHKVVKGGTTQSMRALVVIGNRKGTAGYGEGKSETPHHAIERACRDAKRNLLHVDLYKNRTIYHRIRGEFVQTKVTLWPKPEGSGITGNNNYAAIFQLFGIRDIGAKQHGPRSLINSVKALFNALSKLETPESICASRGLPELPRPPPLKRKPNYRPL